MSLLLLLFALVSVLPRVSLDPVLIRVIAEEPGIQVRISTSLIVGDGKHTWSHLSRIVKPGNNTRPTNFTLGVPLAPSGIGRKIEGRCRSQGCFHRK